MNVILVIGPLNKVLNNICECLISEYNVQLCSEDYKETEAMIKLLNPDLIIVNEISLKSEAAALFRNIAKIYQKKPVLVLSSAANAEWSAELKKYFSKTSFIYKPITKTKLLHACHTLLAFDNPEDGTGENANDEETSNDGAPDLTNTLTANTDNKKMPKPKILVVDDSVILLRNIKAMLEDKYQVFTVTSGETALKSIAKLRPDVILLDYAMPGWDGKKTFEMLCQDEIGRNIPVIFLTSVSEKQQILDILIMKPFGYILKPPSKDRITIEIKKALEHDKKPESDIS